MDRSDQQLVADYLAGDERAFEILLARYLKPIYSFAYRYVGAEQDAEDVTQEVFIKVWRNLKKFNPHQQNRNLVSRHFTTRRTGTEFKTWIFSIAKNTCLDFLKKKKAIPFSKFENEKGRDAITEILVDSFHSPRELFERLGILQTVNSVLEKLSLKYRVVLFLRYNHRFNFREIAEYLGEPLHTIKSRHRRAIMKLRELLADK